SRHSAWAPARRDHLSHAAAALFQRQDGGALPLRQAHVWPPATIPCAARPPLRERRAPRLPAASCSRTCEAAFLEEKWVSLTYKAPSRALPPRRATPPRMGNSYKETDKDDEHAQDLHAA